MPNGNFFSRRWLVIPWAGCLLWSLAAGSPALAQARKPAVAVDTPLSMCVATNRQALLDLAQASQAALRRHVTSPLVVARLQSLQAQLGKLRDNAQRSARTLAECEQAGVAIAAEKDRLLKVAGADPALTDCIAINQKLHTAVSQTYEVVQRSGRLPADQAAPFDASGARLNQIGAALARDGMLAAECRQIGEQLAQERARMEGWIGSLGMTMVAPPAAPVALVPTPTPAPTSGATPAAAAAAAAMATDGSAAAQQACRDSHTRTYNELAQALATVGQGTPMAADRVPMFQSLIERLTRLRGLIADRSGPGWDCEQVNQALEQVRSELQPLLAPAR